MNLTGLIPLLKLLKDASGPVSPIGPPAPDDPPGEIKPQCGPGKYAWQDPKSGFWYCRDIPKGR